MPNIKKLSVFESKNDKLDLTEGQHLVLGKLKFKKLYSKMLFISMEIKDEKDKLDLNYD
jgi:hypothetical protein